MLKVQWYLLFLALAVYNTAAAYSLKVSAGGRYFENLDGKPVFLIGHAEAFGFYFQKMNSKETQRLFLEEMKARGENTIIVQVENEDLNFFGNHRLNLEYPVGVYNEDIAKQFDEFLDLSEKAGIFVITYLWDTFHMDYAWDKSPYNIKNGGPCRYVSDMLTNRDAIELQKKKFKWAIDRWGNRKNIVAWDLMNEIEWAVAGRVPANRDPFGFYHRATEKEMDAWVKEMGAFVKDYELKRWGKTRLRTVSAHDSSYIKSWMVENPEIDFVSNHFYYGSNWQQRSKDYPVKAALEAQKRIQSIMQVSKVTKPYLQTEHGPLSWHMDNPTAIFPHDEDYQHNISWVNWAAGAAGSGFRWPYPNYGTQDGKYLNPFSKRMGESMLALSRVSQNVSWQSFQGRPSGNAFRVSKSADVVFTFASSDENQLLGWALRADVTSAEKAKESSVSFEFSNLSQGEFEVLWFDDDTGGLRKTEKAQGPRFVLTSPPFSKHIAVVVKSQRLQNIVKN